MDDAVSGTVDRWLKELATEDKDHSEWRKKARKIVKKYRDEEKREGSSFNILWSNTKVLHSATLSSRPRPDVTRRFKDPDTVSAQISEVIERALSYATDVYDFDGAASMANLDYLLSGLGQMRVRYIPYFEKGEPPKIPLMTKEMVKEDEETGKQMLVTAYMNGEEEIESPMFDEFGIAYILGEPEDELVYEEVTCETVPWDRFRWQPSSSWEQCNWAAIEHYLSKEELEEQFGDKANMVPLGYSSDGKKASQEGDGKDRARVYEIFDKRERKVIVIAEGCREVLEEQDDPLGLEGFYPFPRPMLANIVSDDTTPTPDYLFYQDQAIELDELTRRIDALSREIKWRGLYDGSIKEFPNISSLDDGEWEPVANWMERFKGRRLEDAMYQMPLGDLMMVLNQLYQAREGVKQTIYEITGLSDIVRGATKATETLGAQQLKQQNAGLRLTEKQNEVNRFFRDLFRIKAEVIAEHFSPETLSIMTGVQVTPEMMDTMQSDMLRSYAIDIETDSTVATDQAIEQENVIKMMTAMTQFLTTAMPLAQAGVPAEAIKEMLLFALRRFKGGRQLEQVINKYMSAPALPAPQTGGMNAGNGAIAIDQAMGGITPQM